MTTADIDTILNGDEMDSIVTVDGDLIDALIRDAGVEGTAIEAAVREQMLLEFGRAGGDPFQMRVGGWRIDLRKSVVQATLASSLMIAAINVAGEGSVPIEILAIALPFLVDVERIEVSVADRYVLGQMRLRDLQPASVEDWWTSLPSRLREEMTQLEFLDLIGRLRDAGAITLTREGTVSLRGERARLRLGWK